MKDQHRVKVQSRLPVKLKPHRLACETVDAFLELAATIESPKVADLFCGAGGLSIGLEEAGFASILGVDYDDHALQTYRSLFPGLALYQDLSDETVLSELSDLMIAAEISVISGGPPCQPFSRAGRSGIRALVDRGIRDPYDQRRDLWQSFLEIVARVKPRAVIMENVPDLALGDEGLILRLIVEDLENAGYSVDARLVDAWRYGVPQHRKRFILIAIAERGLLEWPAEADDLVSVDAAIGDLPAIDGGWAEVPEAGWLPYDRPLTAFQQEMRGKVAGADRHRIYDHVTRAVRGDDREIFQQMDPSTLYSDIDDSLKRYRDDIFTDRYKRLDGDALSRSVIAHIAKDGYGFIHPTQDRTISIREAARLQTFPDHVRFAGPPTAAFRQIGNAVPPRLGFHIGTAVMKAIETHEKSKFVTSEISTTLAKWYDDHGPRSRPWLALPSVWGIAIAEALLSPSDPGYVKSTVLEAVAGIEGPQDVMQHATELRQLAGAPTRRDALEATVEAAREDQLPVWPEQRGSTARLVALAAREIDADVLYSGSGVLRVVARVTGTNVDRVNSGSDGRVLTARMVGVHDSERAADLALVEIAQSVCMPDTPLCGDCPLQPWCRFSVLHTNHHTQSSLWDQVSHPS